MSLMKSELRFSGFLDDHDFAFNQGNLVNHVNPSSDIFLHCDEFIVAGAWE